MSIKKEDVTSFLDTYSPLKKNKTKQQQKRPKTKITHKNLLRFLGKNPSTGIAFILQLTLLNEEPCIPININKIWFLLKIYWYCRQNVWLEKPNVRSYWYFCIKGIFRFFCLTQAPYSVTPMISFKMINVQNSTWLWFYVGRVCGITWITLLYYCTVDYRPEYYWGH